MFISKTRPLAIPQFEHLRISGELALLWGNEDFDAPPISRESLVAGVGLHDRGYGVIDSSPIGAMAKEAWEEIARRGFALQYSDPIADLIAKHHVRRLASHGDTAERKAMTTEFSRAIERILSERGLDRELFERIDEITNLCDRISFAFCFGEAARGSLPVHPRNGEAAAVEVSYRVEGERIHIDPWPLSVGSHQSYVIAYRLEGYPETLDPAILRWRAERG